MPFDDLESVQIESTRRDLEYRTEKYLRKKGWEYTSQTVGHTWMWFKKIGNREYGCGMNDAFRIQDHLDREEYAKAHPEEMGD